MTPQSKNGKTLYPKTLVMNIFIFFLRNGDHFYLSSNRALHREMELGNEENFNSRTYKKDKEIFLQKDLVYREEGRGTAVVHAKRNKINL